MALLMILSLKMKIPAYAADPEAVENAEETGKTEVEPEVKISIIVPNGWYGGSMTVTIKVEDVADSGKFKVKSVKARMGETAKYLDVTDKMTYEVTENGTLQVLVTDTDGKGYEASAQINGLDLIKPSLNAAISEGILTIYPVDIESGVAKVYVNGYAYDNLHDGLIKIRLTQFDAGYENFLIQSEDMAGNLSEVYKVKNPYFKSEDSKDDSDPAKELPVSAEPTDPSDAVAYVKDHYKEGDENASETADVAAFMELLGGLLGGMTGTVDDENDTGTDWDLSKIGSSTDLGTFFGGSYESNLTRSKEKASRKEFYTIETASGKQFYLIIDRTGDDEKVYFLTSVSENDLLNVVSSNSETLPKNSAALSSGVPVVESALPRKPSSTVSATGEKGSIVENEKPVESAVSETKPAQPVNENKNSIIMYSIMGVLGAGVIGAGYYFKVVKKKRDGDFVEEDDDGDNEDEDQVYYKDDDQPETQEKDFFDNTEEEEDEVVEEDE